MQLPHPLYYLRAMARHTLAQQRLTVEPVQVQLLQ